MKFEKYMAIYRNDELDINGDSVKGKTKDVMEYLKYEIAHQCMSDIDYEELINNTKEITDTIESIMNCIKDHEKIIKVWVHPMDGSLCYGEEDE